MFSWTFLVHLSLMTSPTVDLARLDGIGPGAAHRNRESSLIEGMLFWMSLFKYQSVEVCIGNEISY